MSIPRSAFMERVDITRQLVGQALYRQRQAAVGNARRTTAINRAALNLEACPWHYDQEEAELVIISASDPSRRYHIGPCGCDCQAARSGRPCWHAAAYQIVNLAFAIGKQRQYAPAAGRTHEQIQAAADSLFS
jgi:hypothetical protein